MVSRKLSYLGNATKVSFGHIRDETINSHFKVSIHRTFYRESTETYGNDFDTILLHYLETMAFVLIETLWKSHPRTFYVRAKTCPHVKNA